MTMTISPTNCLPRFATPRNPDRLTLGPAVGEVARRLGKPLMPWQQMVADIAHEINPTTGRFAYNEIVLTVPRQSGKTTLELAGAVHRCSATGFFGRRQRGIYTAQDRGRARKKFAEEFVPALEDSKSFASRAHPHWGNGNEHITFRNGSTYGIEANTESAGHGGVLDRATIDEAFSRVDARQEVAFGPAMITRANKQLWIVSTAGWVDASPYLLAKVNLGRGRLEDGRPTSVAYFEWSAPDDADPDDEDVWWDCMPALGHTVTPESIRSELAKAKEDTDGEGLAGFRRSYLNQWVPKNTPADTAISAEEWTALESMSNDRPSPVALSVTVSEDRQWSQIGLAGFRPDGRIHVQIVHVGRGTRALLPKLAEMVDRWKPVAVAVAPWSPAATLLEPIEAMRPRVPLVKVSHRDAATWCGRFEDGVADEVLAHSGQAQVAVSLAAADRKWSGQTWTWQARGKADISPVWALTFALGALGQPKAPKKPGGRRAVVM